MVEITFADVVKNINESGGKDGLQVEFQRQTSTYHLPKNRAKATSTIKKAFDENLELIVVADGLNNEIIFARLPMQ